MTAPQPMLDSACWDRPELLLVLATREVAGIFRWLQRHGWSQTQIGGRTYSPRARSRRSSSVARSRRTTSSNASPTHSTFRAAGWGSHTARRAKARSTSRVH